MRRGPGQTQSAKIKANKNKNKMCCIHRNKISNSSSLLPMNRRELRDKLAVVSLGRIMLVQCQLFFFSGNLMLRAFGEYSPYLIIFFLEILQW